MTRRLHTLGIFIYALATLFLLYEMALQVSPSVMTSNLMHDFQIGAATLGVMASFYFYSYTLMQIPVGLFYDQLNSRTLITGAVFLCAMGALFFSLTQSVAWAALGRFLMGIGSAFAFVGVLVVASKWFPHKYFALLVGIAQFLAAMGALSGALSIASMLHLFSWRFVIGIFAAIGIVLTLLSFLIVRDHPAEERPTFKRHHLFRELKEIFSFSQTWWIALYAFCSWGPMAVFAALWGIPFLKIRFQVSNTEAALAMALVWVGLGIMSPFLGWLSDKIGRRCLLLQVTSLIGLFSSLILIYLPGISFNAAFFLLLGIGIAASGQILTFALVKENNRKTRVGIAIGLNNMAVVAGGALFQPLAGFLLYLNWKGNADSSGIPLYVVENYQIALLVVPACFLLGLVVSSFFIKETYCRSRYEVH